MTNSERQVASGDVRLAVQEAGDPDAPTIVLVHGYPDTSAVWDGVVERLRERFHVVTYDVRGAGASSAPRRRTGYAMAHLVNDLAAVIDAVSSDRPVHLVGHDWGSVQSWGAVTGERLSGRIASFTSMSGPCIDHTSAWIRERLTRPHPRGLAQLGSQALRSWYIGFFQLPAVPELLWRVGLARGWPALLERLEGVPARPGHPSPTLSRDAVNGIELYRANMRSQPHEPRESPEGRTDVPVQLVVPTRDAYVSPALYEGIERWVPRLWRRDIRARHWLPRSRPDVVARCVAEFADHLEGAEPVRELRRARVEPGRRSFGEHLVVVTGAGSGIGRATALAFAELGAEVVAADLDSDTAMKTAELAAPLGAAAHPWHVDVSDPAAMERFAREVRDAHGVPDIVVNNAGVGVSGRVLDTELADWKRVIGVNLWGVIHGSRLFGRQMADRGEGGHIVNVASAAAFAPSRLLPAYSTTKAGVLMLTESLRGELAGEGIGVSAVCPGFVNTAIARTARFAGVSGVEQDRRRRLAARAYELRNYPPERVAREIVRAVRRNAAVVAVSPEARALRAVQRLSPSLARGIGRISS